MMNSPREAMQRVLYLINTMILLVSMCCIPLSILLGQWWLGILGLAGLFAAKCMRTVGTRKWQFVEIEQLIQEGINPPYVFGEEQEAKSRTVDALIHELEEEADDEIWHRHEVRSELLRIMDQDERLRMVYAPRLRQKFPSLF